MNDLQKIDNENTTQTTPFLTTIERLASRPDIDPVKIQQFMDMQERILDRNANQAFNIDMVKAQAGMPIVPLDATNEQTRSKYSLYKTILKHTKPIYTKHGFSVSFYEEDAKRDDEIRVCADVMHCEGHTIKRYIDMPIDDKGIKGTVNKTRPHAKKSSISYCSRPSSVPPDRRPASCRLRLQAVTARQTKHNCSANANPSTHIQVVSKSGRSEC